MLELLPELLPELLELPDEDSSEQPVKNIAALIAQAITRASFLNIFIIPFFDWFKVSVNIITQIFFAMIISEKKIKKRQFQLGELPLENQITSGSINPAY